MAELLRGEAYAKHREWLASDAALQQAAADALLAYCLPAAAAAASADAAADTPGSGPCQRLIQRLALVLLCPSMTPALEQRLQGPSGLPAMQAAIQIIEALPLPRAAGMPAAQFGDLHGGAVQVLKRCAFGMAQQVGAGSSGAAPAEPASSSSAAATAEPAPNDVQQAAWRLVGLVPRLTSIIQALADDPDAATAHPSGPDAWSHELSITCGNLSFALRLVSCLEQQSATPAQLASWAAAAAAGLRLQPLLLRLDASFRQLGSLRRRDLQETLGGAQRLSAALLEHVWQDMPSLQEEEDAAAAHSEAAQRSLALRLWELHSAAARLCHFLVSRGSPALAGTQSLSDTEQWDALAHPLSFVFQDALEALFAWHGRRSGLAPYQSR